VPVPILTQISKENHSFNLPFSTPHTLLQNTKTDPYLSSPRPQLVIPRINDYLAPQRILLTRDSRRKVYRNRSYCTAAKRIKSTAKEPIQKNKITYIAIADEENKKRILSPPPIHATQHSHIPYHNPSLPPDL
jgi:hypothetical protein